MASGPADRRRRKVSGAHWKKIRAWLIDQAEGRCERCGWLAEDTFQLEIDHRNEDPGDNRRENLWVLCACCHRMVTSQRAYRNRLDLVDSEGSGYY